MANDTANITQSRNMPREDNSACPSTSTANQYRLLMHEQLILYMDVLVVRITVTDPQRDSLHFSNNPSDHCTSHKLPLVNENRKPHTSA